MIETAGSKGENMSCLILKPPSRDQASPVFNICHIYIYSLCKRYRLEKPGLSFLATCSNPRSVCDYVRDSLNRVPETWCVGFGFCRCFQTYILMIYNGRRGTSRSQLPQVPLQCAHIDSYHRSVSHRCCEWCFRHTTESKAVQESLGTKTG